MEHLTILTKVSLHALDLPKLKIYRENAIFQGYSQFAVRNVVFKVTSPNECLKPTQIVGLSLLLENPVRHI